MVALAILCGLSGLAIPLLSLLPEHIYCKDLVQEYLIARALLSGENPYEPIQLLVDRHIGDVGVATFGLDHPTPHPPTVGLLFIPLAILGYPAMAWTVFCLKLVGIALAVWLVGRSGPIPLSGRAAVLLGLALCGWYPFSQDLWFGQVGVFILCLLAGARLALLNGRLALGGGLLGTALLVKPLTWPILLVLLPRSRWRGLMATGATVTVGYAAVAAIAGPAVLPRYFLDVLPAVSADYRGFALNISVGSIGWRLFSGTHSPAQEWITAPPLLADERLAAVLALVLPLLLVGACGWLALRRLDLDAGIALLAAVSAIASPIAWGHYLVLAMLPGAWVVRWLARRHWPVRETNRALLVGLLLLRSPYDWSSAALGLAGIVRPTSGDVALPFALAQLTLAPLLATLALAALVLALARRKAS